MWAYMREEVEQAAKHAVINDSTDKYLNKGRLVNILQSV